MSEANFNVKNQFKIFTLGLVRFSQLARKKLHSSKEDYFIIIVPYHFIPRGKCKRCDNAEMAFKHSNTPLEQNKTIMSDNHAKLTPCRL